MLKIHLSESVWHTLMLWWMQLVTQLPGDQQSPMAAVVDYALRLHAVRLTEEHMAVARKVWNLLKVPINKRFAGQACPIGLNRNQRCAPAAGA